jgi:5-methyltetrahydrofolate--homocysteine methyltransferase
VFIGCTPAVAALDYLQKIESLSVMKGVLANAGSGEDGIGWGIAPDGPLILARLARQWANAGADIIGGCCGTRPAHIRAVTDALRFESPASING